MQKWIDKPYGCESSDFEEENDEDNKERADEEEKTDKDEEELLVDNGKDFTLGINSPPSMNKRIWFPSTPSSAPSIDDVP